MNDWAITHARSLMIYRSDILVGADGVAIITIKDGHEWLQWQEPLLDNDNEDGA